MVILTVEDQELSQIISALAVTSVPLIAKLSNQAMAQKQRQAQAEGNGHAADQVVEQASPPAQYQGDDRRRP